MSMKENIINVCTMYVLIYNVHKSLTKLIYIFCKNILEKFIEKNFMVRSTLEHCHHYRNENTIYL